LLVALYLIDVLWIVSQWVGGRISPSWKRSFIPWIWGLLKTVLIIFIVSLSNLVEDVYTTTGLVWLLGINFVAFLVDVILVDYFNAL
jgi:hypothetical protein